MSDINMYILLIYCTRCRALERDGKQVIHLTRVTNYRQIVPSCVQILCSTVFVQHNFEKYALLTHIYSTSFYMAGIQSVITCF